jgi:iron complex outermembrane receptor protein
VEWRTDLYAMSNAWLIDERLQLNISTRRSFITDLTPPPTYAAGVAFTLINERQNVLKANVGTSTSYRAPSINERYWGKDINSYLNPEQGKNVEGGAQYRFDNGRSEATVTANLYRNVISNWIRWMPYGHIWKPTNLQKVRAQGLDVVAGGSCTAADVKLSLHLTYAYSLVTVLEGGIRHSSLNGYQMAYSPKYRGSGTFGAAYKSTSLSANVAYVGLTHSSDIFDIIPAYTLVNLSASQALSVAEHKLELLLSINNLLNKSYQSIQYFAMPGINFECTLKYFFQTFKNKTTT